MRLIRMVLLSGVALGAATCAALAGGTVDLDAIDTEQLAITAAPSPAKGTELLTISKTPQPIVPGLPLSARDKAALGDTATTIRILPSADAPSGGSVSWSGYARSGVVHHGAN